MRQGRVLLADSHLPMLQGVRSLLESLFAAVVMVADEGSLLETIERLDPDLVVVDLSMPVQEGTNIARQLMGRFPGLRLIALSVHDEPTVATQMRDAGVAGFVLKRTAATDLIPAVEAVLGGGSFVSPAVSEQAWTRRRFRGPRPSIVFARRWPSRRSRIPPGGCRHLARGSFADASFLQTGRLLLAVVLAVPGASAHAQYRYPRATAGGAAGEAAGSTVQGSMASGMGIFAAGAGRTTCRPPRPAP